MSSLTIFAIVLSHLIIRTNAREIFRRIDHCIRRQVTNLQDK